MRLIEAVDNWTEAQLIGWLDRNLQYDDITPADKAVFLTAMVGNVLNARGLKLAQILRRKTDLRKIAERKIRESRQAARVQAHQELLFGESATAIVVSPGRCFDYHPDQYPMRVACPDSDTFAKHYYPKVGEIANPEELACAHFLDQLPEVEYWVRNLERQEKFSFWLQPASDKFYPDFVCKLSGTATSWSSTRARTAGATTTPKRNAGRANSGPQSALAAVSSSCPRAKTSTPSAPC